MRLLLALRNQCVATCRDLDPVHANNLGVDHEPQCKLDVTLKRSRRFLEEIMEAAFTPLEYAWVTESNC